MLNHHNKKYLSRQLRLDFVLGFIILANVLNMIFPKSGYDELQTGFVYQLSKYAYGICILIMLPTLSSNRKFYFFFMKYMSIYVILHIIVAQLFHFQFNLGNSLKTLLICLSFVFFEDTIPKVKVNKILIYIYILSVFINIVFLVLYENRLERALANYGHIGGGQGMASALVYLTPLIFFFFKGKTASIFYLIGFLAAFVSMRRTALLGYALTVPFVYKRLSSSISKKELLIIISLFVLLLYYIVSNYWFVLEDRFEDVFVANDRTGEYGSGRTGWWMILIKNFFNSPHYWLQGFGLGQVALHMEKAGFPFGSAHNDYLEIGYTFGVIGLVLWFGTILKLYVLSNNKRLEHYSMLIKMAALSYVFMSFFSGATHQPHFMCISLFVALILREKRYMKKRTLEVKP